MTTYRFEEAIRWVTNGGHARRRAWADMPDYTKATPPIGIRRRWHIWMTDTENIIAGWGGSVGALIPDDDPIRDGMNYRPTDEDRVAQDWELHERGTL